MRQIMFANLILLALVSMLSACKKEDSTLEFKTKLLSETEIKEIGIKHNEALDFVLKELQKHPELNKEQKATKASMASERFLRTILIQKINFIDVPLWQFEDKSCTVIRHLVGTTSPNNLGFEIDDDGGKDSGDILDNLNL